MKKARLIGVTAAIPVAAGGFAAPTAAAAQATTAPVHKVPANGKTVQAHGLDPGTAFFGPRWASVSIPETLHFTDGGSLPHYSGRVYATCYYRGNTGYTDPFWDHFTKYVAVGGHGGVVVSRTGHVADSHVDLDGIASVELPHC